MKSSILKFFKTFPLPLLLSLVLIVSFTSCSQPNLDDIVREHINSVNTEDVEKNLTFFTDDIVFDLGDGRKLSGKDQFRNLTESDAVLKVRLTIEDLNVEGSTVIVKLTEQNELYRLMGIEESPLIAAFKFRGRLIEEVKLESPPDAKLLDEKYKPFEEWVSKENPQEDSKIEQDLPSAEKARLMLSLLKEWKDKTQILAQTETGSMEQELIKLENEWAEAWVKSDVAFHGRIMADDYTWISPWGEVFTKARNLALLKSGDDVIESWVLAEMKVRVYGVAAVVTGCDTIKETYKGENVSSQNRWTHTWIKLAGRWQCVAGHSSEIAQK